MINISLKQAKKDKLFYFVATAVIYRPSDSRALLLKRSGREVAHPGRWGVIGGKLEWNLLYENDPTRINGNVLDWEHGVEDLLVREAKEEAGVEIDASDIRYLDSVVYLRPDKVPAVCVKLAVKYRKGEIAIDTRDFDDYAWVNEYEVKKYECIDGIEQEVQKAIKLFS